MKMVLEGLTVVLDHWKTLHENMAKELRSMKVFGASDICCNPTSYCLMAKTPQLQAEKKHMFEHWYILNNEAGKIHNLYS